MASVFNYLFNIGGDFSAKIEGMNEATGKFTANISSAQKGLGKLATCFASFHVIADGIDRLKQATDTFSASGIALDSQMHDLSAVAGVTGNTLREIEGYARDNAKAFFF